MQLGEVPLEEVLVPERARTVRVRADKVALPEVRDGVVRRERFFLLHVASVRDAESVLEGGGAHRFEVLRTPFNITHPVPSNLAAPPPFAGA